MSDQVPKEADELKNKYLDKIVSLFSELRDEVYLNDNLDPMTKFSFMSYSVQFLFLYLLDYMERGGQIEIYNKMSSRGYDIIKREKNE